jgi:hypothetical protein
MTENPWSREYFDFDRQTELCEDGTRDREVYGLLLDAGWHPHEAHGFIMHMVHARRLTQRMQAQESSDDFIRDAHKRADDEQMRAIGELKRHELKPLVNLKSVALLLGVIYLMATMVTWVGT